MSLIVVMLCSLLIGYESDRQAQVHPRIYVPPITLPGQPGGVGCGAEVRRGNGTGGVVTCVGCMRL
jgi:hypothetical protein